MNIYPYPSEAARERIAHIVGRQTDLNPSISDSVAGILADVKKRKDEALVSYANRFDSPDLRISDLTVTESEFAAARNQVDPAFIASLDRAARQIRAFHEKQLTPSWMSMDRPGTLLGQIRRPVDAAGIYVPGGQGGSTPLVSSVLMNAIPAQVAGVGRILMVTPADREGRVNPHLLVAARQVGVSRVFKVGSAWAIAALAYGTQTVPKCDVIVGPGNIYVSTAKKLVAGFVGIDMIAGPSEILVIADGSAEPELIAADLLSQAEHDPMASAVLATNHRETAEAVVAAVGRQVENLPRKTIAAASIAGYGAAFVVCDLSAAFDLANEMAPEHLELLIAEPFSHIGRIRHAGAVFIGPHAPEPMGDYIAGPNHVLPTSGTARFASALSVDTFIKKTSLIHYDRDAFLAEAPDVIRLAEVEGLAAHAQAVRVRL